MPFLPSHLNYKKLGHGTDDCNQSQRVGIPRVASPARRHRSQTPATGREQAVCIDAVWYGMCRSRSTGAGCSLLPYLILSPAIEDCSD